MKSNLDSEIEYSIPAVGKRLGLVTAEHENNKERTHHKASRRYPANPSPYSGRLWTLSGSSCAALETDNVIRSTAGCFPTTPHGNHFSTGRAFSSKYFHDHLSIDMCVQRPAPQVNASGAIPLCGAFCGVWLQRANSRNGKLPKSKTSSQKRTQHSLAPPMIC
jgi:hypothetical protein